MANHLEGIKKADLIEAIVAKRIAAKQWRSETEKEVMWHLEKDERSRRADVVRFVMEAYDAAGAGFAGRFQ